MRAVLPKSVPVLPVGSITPHDMADYLTAGASGFGLRVSAYQPGWTPTMYSAVPDGSLLC
jgi:2-dehydro-3-deoxyphosphogalactonate aldolase